LRVEQRQQGGPLPERGHPGDWRKEVTWRTKEVRIYTTTIPTKYHLCCPMWDPLYRLSVAWQNVGYNQPPHTSYYLGDGMTLPPQ
jgi:rhamnogalacturonan endolyase